MPLSSFVQLPACKAEVMEVVCVHTHRGCGGPKDPVRLVLQYWAKEGRLLAEFDTFFDAPDVMAAEVLNLREALAIACHSAINSAANGSFQTAGQGV